MAKHQRKVAAALAIRQRTTPKGAGFRTPGSQNRRKTGVAPAPRGK